MSRRHFKICLSCQNYQFAKDKSKGGFYRYGYACGFWNGEPVCKYNITPKNNNGNEVCLKYKSKKYESKSVL